MGHCSYCGSEMIAKCGRVKMWHWAHKSRVSCDPWWESETEWHRNWKNQFPSTWQEVVHTDQETGEKHIADIKTPYGLVIEFQHSAIEQRELKSREAFYENLIWVVDGDRGSLDPGYFSVGLGTKDPASYVPLAYWLQWWGKSRLLHNWADVASDVYIDFGHGDRIWKFAHFEPEDNVAIVMPTASEWFIEACLKGEPIPGVAADENDPLTYERQWVEVRRQTS